jgi:hypothetical protein
VRDAPPVRQLVGRLQVSSTTRSAEASRASIASRLCGRVTVGTTVIWRASAGKSCGGYRNVPEAAFRGCSGHGRTPPGDLAA